MTSINLRDYAIANQSTALKKFKIQSLVLFIKYGLRIEQHTLAGNIVARKYQFGIDEIMNPDEQVVVKEKFEPRAATRRSRGLLFAFAIGMKGQ